MSPTSPPSKVTDPTLSFPRILCLHGGGSNAKIFRLQCRSLILHLQSYFRLCFVDAPFTCEPGPDVNLVYQDYEPFRPVHFFSSSYALVSEHRTPEFQEKERSTEVQHRRWLRWLPTHPELPAGEAAEAIETCLEKAMRDDDELGASGEWVALLGFSQGAKMCASLILRQQQQQQREKQEATSMYRFAVLLAGSPPLVTFDPELIDESWLCDVSRVSSLDWSDGGVVRKEEYTLSSPTIHVHGLRDPGLERHRMLLKTFCREGSTRVVEWEGDHRVPLKSADVKALVDQIFSVARKIGILGEFE